MDELIKRIERGSFTQEQYVLVLNSSVRIWTCGGRGGLQFYPFAGQGFTRSEKQRLWQAIKKGRIAQSTRMV